MTNLYSIIISVCVYRNWSTVRDFPAIAPAGIPFFENKKIDGASLVEDSDLATEIKARIHHYNRAPKGFLGFPTNTSFYLATGDIQHFKKKPYLVSPRPQGDRYLLYTDGHGRMFLEDRVQRILKVDQDRTPQIPKNTVLIGIVTRKIIRNENAQNSNSEANDGKLTFVIMDATRVNGVDLTQKNVTERISTIQV